MIILLFAACFVMPSMGDSTGAGETRIITDMRGVDVTIPDEPQRVVTMSRSLIDTAMYIFGVEDRIVGGSFYQKPVAPNEYVWNGKDYTVDTWIGKVLNPNLNSVVNCFLPFKIDQVGPLLFDQP